MRGIAALGLGGLAAIAVAGVGFIMQPTDSIAAKKGDRLSRVVQIACGTSSLSDSKSCDALASALVPRSGPVYATTASTDGTTTVLRRVRVSE
ncbi:hypothetical protein [Stappia sp.]|uniref:hypothetical protein n=1 Tax=Stappia sp. TaxID=1870903 RepID=UPI003A99F949